MDYDNPQYMNGSIPQLEPNSTTSILVTAQLAILWIYASWGN